MPRRPGPSDQLSQPGRLIRLLVITLLAVTGLVVAPATAAAAPAIELRDVPGTGQRCPAVTVVAAGEGEPDPDAAPTRYSPGAPWVSNGHEGPVIRAFLQKSETRYRGTHDGATLMDDVHVLGLEPRHNPTVPPAAEPAETTGTPEGLLQTILLANRLAHPLLQGVATAADALLAGTPTGPSGAGSAIAEYEEATGCRPQYILIGHARGATNLAQQEQPLAERGQLAGALYLGSPLVTATGRGTVDVPGPAGSLLSHLAQGDSGDVTPENRISYCLPDDDACDTSAARRHPARSGEAGDRDGHSGSDGYLRWDSPWDKRVMDAFGSWVDLVRD